MPHQIDVKALRDAVAQGDQQKHDIFWFCVLGGCGCGTSDELAHDAWFLFNAFHDRSHMRGAINDTPELEVMAHWMDSLGLIEHGGSIIWSWTTDLGDEVWGIINGAEVNDD